MEKEIFSICVARSNSVSSGLFQIHHRARGERMTNRSSFEAGLRILFLLTMLASASSALAQAPPVLNTPYRCANGITYTVTVCKPYRADQWCQWTEQQNGQVVTTVNSSWSSMTGRLQGCTIASASTASTTNSANATSSKASVEAQQSSAQLAARVKAASQQANQANQGNPTQPYGTSPTGAQPLPPTNDPAQIAIRRCFELGGAGLQCVGAGMSVGMKQFLMGIDLNALKGPGQKGLVILGTWTAPSGLNFWFDHGSVGITNCGLMVHGDHGYAVSASGGKYVINIANQPQPLVIMLGPDGRASGPAAQDITGDQVAGYTVTTNVRTGVVVSKVPIYKPITVHCNIGSLKAGAQFAVDPGLPSNDPSPGVLSAIGTVLSTMAGDSGPPQLMLSPGPRMAGIFTGANGFRIQFDDGSAIVDCAQAHILSQYDVSMQSGSAVVSLKNGGNPFNLAIQGDGTLTGSGTAAVDGKIMTALSGADPVFAPTSASCPLNRLSAAK
jgi:hypothetical protein